MFSPYTLILRLPLFAPLPFIVLLHCRLVYVCAFWMPSCRLLPLPCVPGYAVLHLQFWLRFIARSAPRLHRWVIYTLILFLPRFRSFAFGYAVRYLDSLPFTFVAYAFCVFRSSLRSHYTFTFYTPFVRSHLFAFARLHVLTVLPIGCVYATRLRSVDLVLPRIFVLRTRYAVPLRSSCVCYALIAFWIDSRLRLLHDVALPVGLTGLFPVFVHCRSCAVLVADFAPFWFSCVR